MPILFKEFITRDYVKEHPDMIFVFGDNIQRYGYGGQAKEMRGEPNTIGIPTKWKPSMTEDSFFTDDDWFTPKVNVLIVNCFVKLREELSNKKIIVFPKNGIGSGFGQLNKRAPNIYKHIQEFIDYLVKFFGVIEEKDILTYIEEKNILTYIA